MDQNFLTELGFSIANTLQGVHTALEGFLPRSLLSDVCLLSTQPHFPGRAGENPGNEAAVHKSSSAQTQSLIHCLQPQPREHTVPYSLPKITFSSKWVYYKEAVIQQLPVGVQRIERVNLDTPKHHFLCSIQHLLIDSSFRCFFKTDE